MDHEATLYQRLLAAHESSGQRISGSDIFAEAAAELKRLTEYAGNADLLRADIGILKVKLEEADGTINGWIDINAEAGRALARAHDRIRALTLVLEKIAEDGNELAKEALKD